MPRPRATSSITSGAAIALAGIVAYANSFSGPFVFDDVPGIVQNPTLRSFPAALSPPPDGLTVSGRPVLNFSLAINHAFGGDNPWGYHAVNLLILILGALTLFGIVRSVFASLSRDRRTTPPIFAPFFVALLWEVHPLQTESVTYVIQRAESLMGLFFLLSLYCFIRYTESEAAGIFTGRSGRSGSKTLGRYLHSLHSEHSLNSMLPDLPGLPVEKSEHSHTGCFPAFLLKKHWQILSVICCLLAVGTKEVAVTIPVVVFLYDRTFVSGSFREAWRRHRRMHLALAATWILLAWEVAGVHGRGGTAGFGTGVPWTLYLLTQFKAIVHYLGLAVWPHPLVFDYSRHLVLSLGDALPCAVLLAALAAASIWALASEKSGRRAFGFAGVWFFLILAPSSSVVPVATEVVAEHRMYLALIPVIAVIVCAIAHMGATAHIVEGGADGPSDALTSGTRAGRKAPKGLVAPPVIAMSAVALTFLGLTISRNGDYRSEEALWRDTVSKQPDDALAHYNFGIDLLRDGNAGAAKAEFERAVRLAPDYADAYVNLGNVFQQEGRGQEAISAFEQALACKPGSAEAHDDLGIAFANSGRLDQAVAEFQAAVRLNPELAGAHANLGGALVNSGHVQEGIAEFQMAIRLDPGFAQAHYNLGQVLQAMGRGDEARAELEAAARLQSKSNGVP